MLVIWFLGDDIWFLCFFHDFAMLVIAFILFWYGRYMNLYDLWLHLPLDAFIWFYMLIHAILHDSHMVHFYLILCEFRWIDISIYRYMDIWIYRYIDTYVWIYIYICIQFLHMFAFWINRCIDISMFRYIYIYTIVCSLQIVRCFSGAN